MSYPVFPIVPAFTDSAGKPIEAGHVYVGQYGLNAEAYPIQVYWDEALTQPAPQPLRTTGGYITRAGIPAPIYSPGDCSILVKDKNNALVLYSANSLPSFGDVTALPARPYLRVFSPTDVSDNKLALTGAGVLNAATIEISFDGVEQTPGVAWTYGNGVVTFTDAVPGDVSEIVVRAYEVVGASVGNGNFYRLVDDLKSASLEIGETATTGGYHLDGIGGGTYSIFGPFDVLDPDGYGAFSIGNGNIAVLQHNGTVSLEQFGVRQDVVAGDELRAAANFGANRIVCNLPSFTANKIVVIERDNVEWDTSNTLITYTGDYNVYAEFGLSTDRSIGFVTAIGFLGTDTATVTSPIVDGTSRLTLDDATQFSVGDRIQLNIVYPRRSDEQVATIIAKVGSEIAIDYAFGWTVTSCTITKIADPRLNIKVNLRLKDASAATADANKVAGVGFRYVFGGAIDWDVSEHNFPACITYYCQDIFFGKRSGGYGTRPRDVTAGRGYNLQLNNSNRLPCGLLVSRRCRHNWDSSGSSYITVDESHAFEPIDNIAQYTTHGIYEHDITLYNCNHYDGQNAWSVAQSGGAFGEQTKRIKILGGRMNGIIKAKNAKALVLENVSFYGAQATDTEFSANEGTVIRNVKFNNVVSLRITIPTVTASPDGGASDADSILFEDCDFGGSNLRTTDIKGTLRFVRCKNFGDMNDSDLTNYPKQIIFDESEIEVDGDWELKPTEALIIHNNSKVTLEASASFSAGKYALFADSLLTTALTNVRIKFDSPIVQIDNVRTDNSAGIFAINSCKAFNLSNVISATPNAAHSSNQFTVEGTTDCRFVINGMNLEHTGGGNSIWFAASTTKAIMTGSYVEGNIQIAGGVTTAFAGNITPDTILP